ncbi:hypothetical protein ALP36_101895 [Pseudomonas syringae pv. coriandricola]|uniref:Uncharacterized protein n=1 Tax=Pseudomonas syringae pv. coriandricola TaxID=264453 RepID=A0A3M5QXN9_9PSED|nr:hypothetical protein ALP87_101829 [Pseudomonas syringae pv. coriandricola]RMU01571.1 hypothetical protein ALP36_101895 [Pseudomonas syringae pv. coriandricola]
MCIGLLVLRPIKKNRLGGVWGIVIYRLALLKSLCPAAALRRKSHIVVPFYLPPERLERGNFGVGRVWPEFNTSSTAVAQLTRINGAKQRFIGGASENGIEGTLSRFCGGLAVLAIALMTAMKQFISPQHTDSTVRPA